MNKPIQRGLAIITLLLLAVLVSALTLRTVFGDNIFASNFTDNPANVLDNDADYAVLKYSDSTLNCPSGFKDLGDVCLISPKSGDIKIRGWLISDMTPLNGAYPNGIEVDINASELNLNCDSNSSGCDQNITYHTFTTANLHPTGAISWKYRGICAIANNQTNALCTKILSGASVEGILIGRADYADSWPDPAAHWVHLDFNATQCSNGIDDDNDSHVDFNADPDCDSYAEDEELPN